ncbi:phage baseplate assembly protein V [Geovibrio ferrireducens]|uniref:phage baseplate assembly protein V n=1 Tax=Geovibrio ferrireducens TaxID=46201 RepID=UPI002245483B|nr:phage baseplate assembly protein V [Geovibrio ferrireducens]
MDKTTAELLSRIVRVGKVVEQNPTLCAVRVELEDADSTVSAVLRILVNKAQDDKAFWMPDLGEQVLCLFLPNGVEYGFVLGSFYSDDDTPSVSSNDKWHVRFKDGTEIEYDREKHILSADVKGQANIKASETITVEAVGDVMVKSASKVTIDAPETIVTQKLTVEGLLEYKAGLKGSGGGAFSAEITGALKASTIDSESTSLDTHVHGGVASGSETSGGPQ